MQRDMKAVQPPEHVLSDSVWKRTEDSPPSLFPFLLPNKNQINLKPVGKSQTFLKLRPTLCCVKNTYSGEEGAYYQLFRCYFKYMIQWLKQIFFYPMSQGLHAMIAFPKTEKIANSPTGQTEHITPDCNTAFLKKRTPQQQKSIAFFIFMNYHVRTSLHLCITTMIHLLHSQIKLIYRIFNYRPINAKDGLCFGVLRLL